ncbi:MAG: glycosyltransferase [Planctomycetia bacterium]|nr:glycosyltransferase [Planctomycetia bacterium]
MRRRVLFVIPTLDRCGAEKQMTLLAKGLPPDEFQPHVAVLTRLGPYKEDLEAAGVPISFIDKGHKISLSGYHRLKSLIRRFKPDVVHTWLFAANSYGRQAAFACKTPVVICGERCVDPWKGALHGWIDAKLSKRTDAYIVNSSGIVDFYTGRGLPETKFHVIPNAVQTPPWVTPQERKENKRRLLEELGLPLNSRRHKVTEKGLLFDQMDITETTQASEEPYLIGLIARFWPQKRIEDALWTADQLKFALMNFYLIVIGDGPERERLLRYREDLQLKDRVIFLGEQSNTSRFMKAFDLVWNCSAYEGQSNSILEAMAHGVPVVASDIPGNRDLVVPNYNGSLIPEYDYDATRRRTALSRETLRLLNPSNSSLMESWSANAHAWTKENFSLDAMIERHVKLYRELLQKKGL